MIIDVHFTTIPPRYLFLQKTIDSWLDQTVPVRNIVITVSKTYKNFPKNDLIQLDRYKDVIIQVLDSDHGPNDKIVGALNFANSDSDSNVSNDAYMIICDDDHIYHPRTVESYIESLSVNKDDVYTHFSTPRHRLPGIHHLQGADTYILPPSFFRSTSRNGYIEFLENCFRECPDSFYQDDYLISYYLAVICKYVIKSTRYPVMYKIAHQIEELHNYKYVLKREAHTVQYLTAKIQL